MIAGEIDMCSYSASLLAPARVQGADLVMIVSFQQKLNYRLVVRPEIRTLAELKGKVLGVTRYGTVNDATMRLLLNKLGVDPERDVRLIQVGDSAPVVATALIAGKTFDGALLQPPYYNKAVEAGMRVFANMEEMDIPFQQVGLNTTQKYIAKNPDVVAPSGQVDRRRRPVDPRQSRGFETRDRALYENQGRESSGRFLSAA